MTASRYPWEPWPDGDSGGTELLDVDYVPRSGRQLEELVTQWGGVWEPAQAELALRVHALESKLNAARAALEIARMAERRRQEEFGVQLGQRQEIMQRAALRASDIRRSMFSDLGPADLDKVRLEASLAPTLEPSESMTDQEAADRWPSAPYVGRYTNQEAIAAIDAIVASERRPWWRRFLP